MSQPLSVSVVIPVYNRAHFIVECLDSVASQTLLPHEIIVVDDGSTDETPSVVREWSQRTGVDVHLICQSNRGAAAARNTAILASHGRLIALLDSDDVWLPTHLERLVEPFERYSDLALSAGNTERLDNLPLFKTTAYGEDLFQRLEYDEDENGFRMIRGSAFRSLLKGAYIHSSSCVFSRELACRVGLFDEALRSFEDQLFFMRLSRHGRFGLYMDPVTLVRKHDSNLTHRRNIASHILCSIRALEKARSNADAMELTADERRDLERVLARKIARAADRASRYGWRPFWTVCSALARQGYFRSILRPKAFLRATLRPWGDRQKLQQALPNDGRSTLGNGQTSAA